MSAKTIRIVANLLLRIRFLSVGLVRLRRARLLVASLADITTFSAPQPLRSLRRSSSVQVRNIPYYYDMRERVEVFQVYINKSGLN